MKKTPSRQLRPASDRRERRHRAAAYTLLELLVALSIFLLAAAAISAGAAGALRIYGRAQSITAAESDLLLALERIERDLCNTFAFANIKFEGDSGRLAVPAIVRITGNDAIPAPQPGQAIYSLDRGTGRLINQRASYASATAAAQRPPEMSLVLAEQVADLSFRYLAFEPLSKSYAWRDQWPPENGLPIAVEVSLAPRRAASRILFRRTVFIPTAYEAR